jgi:hypothetical protein
MSHFEMIFVRFLHLLAHHPDFSLTQESVPDMAKYAHPSCSCLSTRLSDIRCQIYRLLPHIRGFRGKHLVTVPPIWEGEDCP